MRKGATRPRTPSPAHEGDGRHQKRRPEGKRDSAGHMGTMWSSPLCRNEASQVVGWQFKKSLPCCRRSSQPRLDLRLQARGGSAGVRPFRRARSARAIGRPRSHEDALVSLRSATLCKFVGGASARRTPYVVGLQVYLGKKPVGGAHTNRARLLRLVTNRRWIWGF
jgi:hypothetical protein